VREWLSNKPVKNESVKRLKPEVYTFDIQSESLKNQVSLMPTNISFEQSAKMGYQKLTYLNLQHNKFSNIRKK